MFGIMHSFFKDICDNLKCKYEFGWPVMNGGWMAENNIAIETAKLAESEKYNCFA